MIAFFLGTAFSWKGGWRSRRQLIQFEDPVIGRIGVGLAISQLLLHVIFH